MDIMSFFFHRVRGQLRGRESLSPVLLMVGLFGLAGTAHADTPSFSPGFEPVSSYCDGDVRFVNWLQNIRATGDPAQLRFQVTSVGNPEIFDKSPWVSWPSRSLNYRIKAGTAAGLSSTVTAILIDDAESSVSAPRSWHIFTRDCDAGNPIIDTDGDGLSDNVDADDDDDGISDIDEGNGLIDTDGDGTANSLDADSDNDAIADAAEPGDSNNNGVRDSEEPGTGVTNSDRVSDSDRDGDGINNELDIDDDNDGIIDTAEGDGLLDTDNDGIADSYDLDSDNDGRSDLLESGLNLILLAFSANWSLQDDVGDNGLVDLIETFADSGVPLHQPVDVDANGRPDFQDNAGLTQLQNDEAEAGDSALVATGIDGVGCRLLRGGMDPSLALLLLAAMAGLRRRRTRRN
jgi:hypothetical protein